MVFGGLIVVKAISAILEGLDVLNCFVDLVALLIGTAVLGSLSFHLEPAVCNLFLFVVSLALLFSNSSFKEDSLEDFDFKYDSKQIMTFV